MVTGIVAAGVLCAGVVLTQPSPTRALEGRSTCSPLTPSERDAVSRAAAAILRARSRIVEIGNMAYPLTWDHPMIEGVRVSLARGVSTARFHPLLPADPLACRQLIQSVWTDPERSELLIEYRTGIKVTEEPYHRPSPGAAGYAIVAREMRGSGAQVGMAHSVTALLIPSGPSDPSPASVGFVLPGVSIVVYGWEVHYSTAVLARVAGTMG